MSKCYTCVLVIIEMLYDIIHARWCDYQTKAFITMDSHILTLANGLSLEKSASISTELFRRRWSHARRRAAAPPVVAVDCGPPRGEVGSCANDPSVERSQPNPSSCCSRFLSVPAAGNTMFNSLCTAWLSTGKPSCSNFLPSARRVSAASVRLFSCDVDMDNEVPERALRASSCRHSVSTSGSACFSACAMPARHLVFA